MLKKTKKQRKPRIIITSYKIGSQSAKLLQGALKELCHDRQVLRVRKESDKYKPRESDYHIFWGNCSHVPWADAQQEQAKATAANKLRTFEVFQNAGVAHPEWTTSREDAAQWIREELTILARLTLTGHSGEGILLLTKDDVVSNDTINIPMAPLYVKYKKKKHEFRVHVFNGEVLDVVQKKRKAGFEGRNNQIRNHANGWVFCRENVTEPDDLRQVSIAACNALGLKFGAVDVIYNEKENKCYALEVNTAPGIEGTTLTNYANAFKKEIE